MHFISDTASVLIELLFMLFVSWKSARKVLEVHAFRIDADTPGRRLQVGLMAFTLFLIAEMMLGVLLTGQTLWEHIYSYKRLSNQIGLMGQAFFALCPWLQLRRSPHSLYKSA